MESDRPARVLSKEQKEAICLELSDWLWWAWDERRKIWKIEDVEGKSDWTEQAARHYGAMCGPLRRRIKELGGEPPDYLDFLKKYEVKPSQSTESPGIRSESMPSPRPSPEQGPLGNQST